MWIRRSAVCWRHATFAEVLACCRYLHVVVENRSQVGPGMAVLEALGVMALVRRFQGPLAVTLAMEWRFQGLLAVKLALERRFRERLGAWKDPKGAPRCRKERPIAPELTPRGRKSMRSKPWKPQKTNFVKQLPQVSVLECFFIDFWCFREVSEASEVPRLSAKTGVGPFVLWVALEPQKTLKI